MGKKKFSTLIWNRAKQDIKEYYHKDRRGWVYNIGSAFIVAILSPIIYFVMGLIAPAEYILSILAGLISGFVFFFIWRVSVFVYYFYKAPGELYREKEVEANRNSWKDVEILNYIFPEHSGFGVGLKLVNHKSVPYNIFPTIYIENIFQNGEPIVEKRLELFLFSSSNELGFERSGPLMSVEAEPDSKRIFAIPVTKYNENQAWIEAQDDRGEKQSVFFEQNIDCFLKITLSGRAEGMDKDNKIVRLPLDSCQVDCILRHHQKSDGKMEMLVKVERYPKFVL